MLVDLHIHSKYSFDAKPDEISQLAASAAQKGLSYIGITDHKDYFWKLPPMNLDITSIQKDIDLARSEFAGQIEILKGIEIGEIYAHPDAIELTKQYPFDMVIGSLHSMPNDIDFYDMDYAKLDCNQLLKEYFAELKKMVDYGGFDVLAHIDYPLRKMEHTNITSSFANYMELLIPVLRSVIDHEMALELNAAGLFSWIDQPGLEGIVLEEYRRLGGQMISFGSDAHAAADVGRGIATCMEHAKQYGFTQVTVFQQRKPHLYPLGRE